MSSVARASRRVSSARSKTMERAHRALDSTVTAAEDAAQAAASAGQEMVVAASKVQVEPFSKTFERFKRQQLFPALNVAQKVRIVL